MKDFNPTLTRVEYPIEAKYVRKKRTYPFFLRKVAPKEEYVRNVFTNKGITQKLKSPTRKRQHSTLQVPTKENESKSAVEMFLKTLFTGNGNGLNAKNVLPFFSKTRSSTRTPIHATYRNLSVIEKRNEETRVWQLKCRQPGTQRSSRSRQVRTESDVLLVGW